MLEGTATSPKRLPFTFEAVGGVGRLVLRDHGLGPLWIDRLELEVAELGTNPGVAAAEKFQRRRTRLRNLAIKITAPALDARIAQIKKQLAALGVTQLAARLGDGFVSVRARAADGLAAADLTFHIQLGSSGMLLRALTSTMRVHGHLPTPGPVIADRIVVALLGAVELPPAAPRTRGSSGDGDERGERSIDRPRVRGLCDVEIDLVNALLWHLMPPNGWRLPAVSNIELASIKTTRGTIEISYGPAGTRSGELGVRPATHALAAAHDLMLSVDQQMREGHLEDAMRGYRALLAAGGPDQPVLLERILALAGARPAWFFDGLELARQALGRWPQFPPAHAALASITLAQGDAREAASQLAQLAQLASADGDDDQAALAALAGARLLRVLEPRSATQLYQLALEHDPASSEAADSLADRLADEQRWPELVRLVRARAAAAEPARAVQLRLRLADVMVHQLGDLASAQEELAAARALAADDPAVHEMTATILASSDPAAAIDAWREVARLGAERGDHRTAARAWATVGDLLAGGAQSRTDQELTAQTAWRHALSFDLHQADALVGLARAAAARGEHAEAAELYERLRGLGLPQHTSARHELALARCLVALDRVDEARSCLRRATLAGGEIAAEAHAILAEIAEATADRDHAAQELDTAISSLVDLASDGIGDDDRLLTRAAELAIARATLLDSTGNMAAASADWQRAHALAQQHAPEIARSAARTLLARSGDDAHTERRWIDAVLATRPPGYERAALLVRRADVRRRERTPDLAAALADLHEALALTEEDTPEAAAVRRSAYQAEAELLAQSGDQRARAQALAALARMAERAPERVASETAAAAAWLAADEPAAALPHGARAQASIEEASGHEIPAGLKREVLTTLGEAAWRQRAWPDVIRAYRGLLDDPGPDAPRAGTFRYRLAVAADRSGDGALALETLQPLVGDVDAARALGTELRGQALRLYADLAERAGDLAGAAGALETFAQLSAEGSTTARADAMYRAGELFRRGDRADDAIRCLEAALRISESHLPALDALETAWRERGDLERVSVILGRKVAATARHPARQKPLLSRLGDLQAQLGRPDVALATHQRALEIDPAWRPSLKFVSLHLRDTGQWMAAAGGLAQLAGDLPGDAGSEAAVTARERQLAASALAELVGTFDDDQLEAVRDTVQPALERAGVEGALAALARLRGEQAREPITGDATREEDTASGRKASAPATALSLRDAAQRERTQGKLEEAFATLETANHVNPGDPEILRELVDLAAEIGDHVAGSRHLVALADLMSGSRRGNVLLELADIYYDKLDSAPRARVAMRAAAEAFGTGARRDSTLRMLATESSTHLAWDVACDALLAIAIERRTVTDVVSLASALQRAGRDADAIDSVEEATNAGRFDDGGVLFERLVHEADRKATFARTLEVRAEKAGPEDAAAMLAEARELRQSIGQAGPAEDSRIIELLPPMENPTERITHSDDGVPVLDRETAQMRERSDKTLAARLRAPTRKVVPIDASIPAGPAEPAEPSEPPEPAEPAPPAATAEPPAEIHDAAPPADEAAPVEPVEAAHVLSREMAAPSEPTPEPTPEPTSTLDPAAIAEWLGEDGSLNTPSPSRTKTWPGMGTSEKTPAPHLIDDDPEALAEEADAAIGKIRLVRQSQPSLPDIVEKVRDGANGADHDETGWVSVSDPKIASGPVAVPTESEPEVAEAAAEPRAEPEPEPSADGPSVVITGTPAETAEALSAAAASADRERLIGAHQSEPDDPALLLALLVHLGNREPGLKRDLLEGAARTSRGRALAIALHELGLMLVADDPARARALWNRAFEADEHYAAVWLPLADALSDTPPAARALYLRIADSDAHTPEERAAAGLRAAALAGDESIVAGEIKPPRVVELERAEQLAAAEDWPGAIAAAERAASLEPEDAAPLELLERLYIASGDVTAASEAIGRQLVVASDPIKRASLWRRRARLYRDSLGRDAEAYRCLKEAHACSPADPEISYQLRTAAMVRGEWALAASLLYREIAASSTPRDRGALHLELALIYDERLDDPAQAQVNFEQALAFDPTIPAAKLPLARRYQEIGRHAESAKLFEEAAATARAGDRATLLEAASRSRAAAAERDGDPDLAAQLDRAEAMGDLDTTLDLAHQLWAQHPGHASAFRVLANMHRASGDLAALTELTKVRAGSADGAEERATAWLEVARLAEDVGALDQAARAYDHALIEDPGHLGALDARGALAFRLGDFSTADMIYRDLGSGESVLGDDELALRRSIIAEQLGRDTEALEHARAASAAAPGRRDLLMRVQELATRIGDLEVALVAARALIELVPVDDDAAQLATQFSLVDLLRQAGEIDLAIQSLEGMLRVHPLHAGVLDQLAELHMARADWQTATRYLYQLVPLAPSPPERAERLYRLGEAVLVHLGDTDRADDVFLRASDLDPTHLPTLRRLLDVYWRADDPGALVEVASELADKGALAAGHERSLAHAMVAAALVGDTQLAQRINTALGDSAPESVAAALAELAGRQGRLQLATASTAIAELARRGLLDLARVRAAAAGTPVANMLVAQ